MSRARLATESCETTQKKMLRVNYDDYGQAPASLGACRLPSYWSRTPFNQQYELSRLQNCYLLHARLVNRPIQLGLWRRRKCATSGARGAHFLIPQTNLVLDIGSQSTRAMSMTENGKVKAFKSNDKCAAGSGSFIQRAAKYLEVGIEDVGELAMRATSPQPISSVCAVLAESEIINLVSTGLSVEDIMRGIYDSLADRAALLLKRVGSGSELVFIGGVATQRGMVKALEDHLKLTVIVPPDCEYVCALGAALLGLKRCNQSSPALKSTSQMDRPLERVV